MNQRNLAPIEPEQIRISGRAWLCCNDVRYGQEHRDKSAANVLEGIWTALRQGLRFKRVIKCGGLEAKPSVYGLGQLIMDLCGVMVPALSYSWRAICGFVVYSASAWNSHALAFCFRPSRCVLLLALVPSWTGLHSFYFFAAEPHEILYCNVLHTVLS